MVDFAGYMMPVQYSSMGAVASHHHTRNKCSIFDVSHMLQTRVFGKDKVEFMESLTVADVSGLAPNAGSLTVFTTPSGGIIDDLIVTNAEDHLYVVSNAGCRHKDIPLMEDRAKSMQAIGKDLAIEFVDDMGLVAVQGPLTAQALQPLTNIDLRNLLFMRSAMGTVAGIDGCRVTRCGYTGEDGVEISVPEDKCQSLVEAIMESQSDVALAGLGARDSLRLESGLCLYGNDIDETTSPVEAGLTWTIGKPRRAKGGFPGSDVILDHLKNGVTRKRVGLISKGPPARSHTDIVSSDGEKVGEITSGCPSPSLGKGINVSMGYVEKKVAKNGTVLQLNVRNKLIEAVVTKMPFVPSQYYYKPT